MVNNLFYYSASVNLTTKGGKLAMWMLNQHEAGMLPLTTSQSMCLLMILNIQKAHPQFVVLVQFLFTAMQDAWPLCYIQNYINV